MTFHRLLFREIVVPLVMGLVLVCLMLVVLQILQLNDVLFGSGFDLAGVLRTAVYLAPHFGVIAVPLAFLLAVMLALGRLAEDNELVAFTALGRSPLVLYAVPAVMGLLLGGVVAWLGFEAEPWGFRGIHQQLDALIKRNVAGDIRAGTFYEEIPRFTIYVDDTDDNGWQRVLLHDSVGDGTPFFITATRGHVESEGAGALLSLELDDGELHRATKTGDYSRAHFERASFALGVSDFLSRQNKFNRPANELRFVQMPDAARAARQSGDEKAAVRIEMARLGRVSSIFSCLVFGLIAVPLAAGGRSSSFVATVLAFASYYVLQTVFRGLGEDGSLPLWLGAWMPNFIGLAIAGVLAVRLLSGSVAGSRR